MIEHSASVGGDDPLAQAIALIADLRDSLKSVNGAFDAPFSEDIAKADVFLAACKDATVIGPWDSKRYGHQDNPQGMDVETTLMDRRKASGHVFFDMQVSGDLDDTLSMIAEVADHPESGQPTPVIRIYRGEGQIASAYADGMDKTLLVIDREDINEGLLRIHREG